MKRASCAMLLILMAVCLSGCAPFADGGGKTETRTLPPAVQTNSAPEGDAGMRYACYQSLYLPARDGSKLIARQVQAEGDRGASMAREAINLLLDAREDDHTLAVGGETRLQLSSGAIQVETAGDVCTVNLSASALALDYEQYYLAGLSIAATLSGVDGIRYVNVLAADQAVGMDVPGFLPTGTLTAHPNEELPVLWEQLSARRTPAGADASSVSLNATATLYFPLEDADGFTPEARNLYFGGQTPQVLAQTLLRALCDGPAYSTGAAVMPDLTALSRREPDVSEMPDGGRLVTFFFEQDAEIWLREAGVRWDSFVGALNYTMTTFIPSVGAIRIYLGDTMVMSLEDSIYGDLSFENGFMRRRQFVSGLRGVTQIYLAGNGLLTRAQRAVPSGQEKNPRVLLTLMLSGPLSGEELAGVLPAGLNAEDILGLSAEGDTLSVNLSGRFANALSSGRTDERLACYAMVDTLCESLGLSRVRFYFDGEVRETLGGILWWGGEFIYNSALIEENRG